MISGSGVGSFEVKDFLAAIRDLFKACHEYLTEYLHKRTGCAGEEFLCGLLTLQVYRNLLTSFLKFKLKRKMFSNTSGETFRSVFIDENCQHFKNGMKLSEYC